MDMMIETMEHNECMNKLNSIINEFYALLQSNGYEIQKVDWDPEYKGVNIKLFKPTSIDKIIQNIIINKNGDIMSLRER